MSPNSPATVAPATSASTRAATFNAATVQDALRRAVSALIDAEFAITTEIGDVPPWLDAATTAAQDALYHHIALHGSNPA